MGNNVHELIARVYRPTGGERYKLKLERLRNRKRISFPQGN